MAACGCRVGEFFFLLWVRCFKRSGRDTRRCLRQWVLQFFMWVLVFLRGVGCERQCRLREWVFFSISVRVKFREGLVARPGAVSDSSCIIFYVGACVFVSCTWVRVFLVARGSRFGAVCGAACYLFRVGACVFACRCVFCFGGEGSREIRRHLCVVRPGTSTCPLNKCLRQCVFLQGQ